MTLFEALTRRVQDCLHQEDLAGAKAALDELRKLPGDIPPIVRAIVQLLEAHYLIQQRDFESAKSKIRHALATCDDDYIKANAWSALAGIEMREQPTAETVNLLRSTLELAERISDAGLIGDVAFNLGTLQATAGDVSSARALFRKAHQAYTRSGRQPQVLDCLHVIAALNRVESAETEDDLDLLRQAVFIAIERHDAAAVSRIAGDLARTHLCRFMEGKKEELELAEATLKYVDHADHLLWQSASSAESSIGARIERAEQSFYNIETAILVAAHKDNLTEAFGRSCEAKARILRDDIRSRLAPEVERYRSLDARFTPLVTEALAVSAFPHAAVDLVKATGKSMAVIEQFAFTGDQLFMTVDLFGPSESSRDILIADWTGERKGAEGGYFLRGDSQGANPRRVAIALAEELERYAGPVSAYLFDATTGTCDPSQTEALRGETARLEQALNDLGRWLFPPALTALLLNQRIDHVFLSPDPRFFSIPWNALLLDGGGAVVDQPWTLSLLPSSLSIYDLLRRRRVPMTDRKVVLAPDREINARMGGDEEIAAVASLLQKVEMLVGERATLDALRSGLEASGWVHLRTHGTQSSEGTFVPKLADGPWTAPLPIGAAVASAIVASCCRTGDTDARGQDVFGMFEIAERNDTRAVVAPVVSVEGYATRFWMTEFYGALVEGKSIAEATQLATRRMRTKLIHPTYWGMFVCFGDGLIMERI